MPKEPGVEEFSKGEMIAIAKAQRGVLLVLLAHIGVVILRVSMEEDVLWLAGFVVILPLAMFFTYRLATGLRHYAPLLFTLALCIPLLNIIVLFVLSGKATKVIRAHGHEVGLLGADRSKLESGKDERPG